MYSICVVGQNKCELTFRVGVHKNLITLQERLFSEFASNGESFDDSSVLGHAIEDWVPVRGANMMISYN